MRERDDQSGKDWLEHLGSFFMDIFGGFLIDLLVFLFRGVGHLLLGLLHVLFHFFD